MPFIPIDNEWLMLAIDIVAWFIVQVGLGLVVFNFPPRWYDYRRPCFHVSTREEAFYRSIRLHRWKKYLPEYPGIGRHRFAKRHLDETKPDYLRRFITSTCRVEMVHVIVMLPLPFFIIWNSPFMFSLNIIYCVAMNVPFWMIQRFNRPRLVRLLHLQGEE